MISGSISTVTPNDVAVVEGASMLTVVTAGNLVLKGTQPGAAATGAIAVTAGMQLYVPDRVIVMAATTAVVAVMG